jgi:hypothetical protein
MRISGAELRKIGKSFDRAIYVSLAGLLGILAGAYVYPPVDLNPVAFAGLVIFFVPMLTHIVLAVRHRLQFHVPLVKKSYQASAVGLTLFTAMLFANGALDRNPAKQVNVLVARKSVSSGRNWTSYTLDVVPSWRAGRSGERLEVSRATFSRVHTGAPAHLTVHPGVFGLTWFDEVNPG